MRKFIAGNWKMNGSQEMALGLVRDIARALRGNPRLQEACDFCVFPPALYIPAVRNVCEEHRIYIGGQDCAAQENGAFTGDIAAAMFKDAGANFVIVGHSERRQQHAESSDLVQRKVAMAHRAGLTALICVGETGEEREAGRAESVVGLQLIDSMTPNCTAQNTIIAYEPVWAIGTGKVAQAAEIAAMHNFLRQKLVRRNPAYREMRLLYGGSVKPENAPVFMTLENVNGALIGGASLRADQFLGVALSAVKD